MKNIIIAVISVFVLALSIAGCSNNITNDSQSDNQIESQTESSVTESNDSEVQSLNDGINDTSTEDTDDYVHVYSSSASRMGSLESFTELKDNSPFIFTGECISSEPIYQNETLYTLSQVKVENVYKGELSKGDIVYVVEMGGRSTFGVYEEECNLELKAFESEADRLPSDTKVAIGIEGYFPMREGEQVLLFAGDTSGFLKEVTTQLLDVMSDWDGKFILQDDGSYKKPASSDEDKLVFDENSLVITLEELSTIK